MKERKEKEKNVLISSRQKSISTTATASIKTMRINCIII
jgi:hypothetical protein